MIYIHPSIIYRLNLRDFAQKMRELGFVIVEGRKYFRLERA